jgi:hypothetical protein
VVSSTRTIKDGRTVRQYLIDTYAANHPGRDGDKKQPLLIADDDDVEPGKGKKDQEVKEVRKGAKYQTPFHQQLRVLTVRTFKQRRPAILSNSQIILVLIFSIVSGLFWLRMDKAGTRAAANSSDVYA